MRDVAALMGVVFHARMLFGVLWHESFFAGDIFFVLSGVVIANAYEASHAAPGNRRRHPLVLACLLILPMREATNAFPLNPPTWSLFFELVINAVDALAVRKLNDRVTVAIMAVSGLAIAGFSLHHSLDAGWTWKSLPFGALRVTYSFFAGAPDLRASAGVRHARWPPRARGSRASRSPSACLYSVYDSSSIIQRF